MSAGTEDGTWLFKGRELTAFSDEEERLVGLAQNSASADGAAEALLKALAERA